MEDKRQAEALFRYWLPSWRTCSISARARVITPLLRGLSPGSASSLISKLRRWLRYWRQGGFQALLPGLKLQPNRTPAAVLEAAIALKREAPGRTAPQVARILAEAQVGQVSSRTLQRHFARLGPEPAARRLSWAGLRALRGHRVW